jgi:hypothetical protein
LTDSSNWPMRNLTSTIKTYDVSAPRENLPIT